jgi:hypothetical protein
MQSALNIQDISVQWFLKSHLQSEDSEFLSDCDFSLTEDNRCHLVDRNNLFFSFFHIFISVN